MRSAWLWTAIFLFLIAGGSYGLYARLRPVSLPEQVLYGNGHVEGTEVTVAAEVSGRVIESHLVEGKPIVAGDLLVRLDDTDFRLNEARMEAEIAALEQERERVLREREVAEHHAQTAEINLSRYRELEDRGTVSPRRLEEAEDAYRGARGHAAAIEAGIGATEKRITAAEREMDIIANRIAKTRITSPLEATILIKAVEKGEFVLPGQPVATLVDLAHVDLRVFIPERDIAKVTLGASARLRVDAYPERLIEARVARVDQAAQFTPRDIHMPSERVRLVFGVTLEVDNPDGALKPGMPADAWILWKPATEWPDPLFVPQ